MGGPINFADFLSTGAPDRGTLLAAKISRLHGSSHQISHRGERAKFSEMIKPGQVATQTTRNDNLNTNLVLVFSISSTFPETDIKYQFLT